MKYTQNMAEYDEDVQDVSYNYKDGFNLNGNQVVVSHVLR